MHAAVTARALRAALWLFVFLIFDIASGPSAEAEEQGFLGMQVQGISPRIAEALNLQSSIGVIVRDISVDGPASNAGIARGDLIVKMHGTVIDTFERLLQVSGALKPGETVEVEVLRLDEKHNFKMTLSDWPEGWQIEKSTIAALPELGLTFAALTPKIRQRLGVRWGSTGIVVTVSGPSASGVTALQRGDIVAQINQRRIWDPQQFLDLYAAAKKDGRQALLLLIERVDGFKYVLQPIQSEGAGGVEAPAFKYPGQSGG